MKKLFALLVAAVMSVSLIGCGGGTDEKKPEATTNTPAADGGAKPEETKPEETKPEEKPAETKPEEKPAETKPE